LVGVDEATRASRQGHGKDRPQGGPTSLVPSRQSVPPSEAPTECRSGPPDQRLLNLETKEVRPVPCKRLKCPPCLRRAAWRRSLAISYVRPERFVTLTLVGDDWQTVRARVKRFRHDVVSSLGDLEWCWTVERNPRGTGHHVHAYQRGSFLAQRELSKMAGRRGMGRRVDIRRWEGSGGTSYALKEAYALKGSGDAERYLSMNGGRLTHQSRGFFPGPVKEVERQAVAAHLGPDSDRWVVVSLRELHEAHGVAPREVRP
jgi:hypothetical protein